MKKTSDQPYYSLTSAQKDIWLDQLLHHDLSLYNIGGYTKITGQIDTDRFVQAVSLLIQQHDNLRLQLVTDTEGQALPQQVIVPPFTPDIEVHDFSGEDNPLQAAQTWMQSRFVQPFALYNAPLFRYDLIRAADNEYYWLAQYHHLIIDGWSIALLNRALGECYRALSHHTAPTLSAPAYTDHIIHHQTYLNSPQYAQDATYWQSQFTALPEALFSTRSALATTSQCIPCYLPRALYTQLAQYARQHHTSLFQVLLGTFALYLARTQQQNDLIIGLPTLNRSGVVAKNTAGLFTGISPTRLQFDLQQTLPDLLRAMGRTLQQGYRHQRFPLSEINRAVKPQSLHHQLYDVVLSYEQHDYQADFGTGSVRTELLLHGHAQTPLTVYVRDFYADGDIKIDFVYNTACFDAAAVQAMQARWLHLLSVLPQAESVPVSQLPFLTPADQVQLRQWCATEADMPQGTVVNLFEQQVTQSPDQIAISYADTQLTYRQLNERANQLAHYLLQLQTDCGEPQVQPDTCVGLCVERSAEMVVGLLGILKAGAAYLPLDPDAPCERLISMLADSQAPVILTTGNWSVDTTDLSLAVIRLNLDETAAWAALPTGNPVNITQPDHLAYVIYTSGTTGQPKGVQVPHAALSNLRHALNQRLNLTGSPQRYSLNGALFFDTSVKQWLQLTFGHHLVIIPAGIRADSQALTHYLRQHRVEVLDCTPTQLRDLLAVQLPEQCPELKQAWIGGEAIEPALWQAIQDSGLGAWNLYGPTECTGDSTLSQIQGVPQPVLGHPLPNVRCYILDAQQQPLPHSVTGELCIAGAGLARGYLNQPELTAEKFIEIELFGKTERIYKTGDLACWLPDGNLAYLGRIDHQIKLRGYRIEPGEIEVVLSQQPEVHAAVVVMYEAAEYPVLAAYITTADEAVDLSVLRARLRTHLPEYMVPGSITVLEQLPLTPNSKLNRDALPAPVLSTLPAPGWHTELEPVLAELWSAVLNRAVTQPDADFFALGGHSLIATQLATRVRDQLGIEMGLREVFTHPILQQQANWLAQQQRGSELPVLVPQIGDSPHTLSYAQQRLWFLARLTGPSAIYSMPDVYRIQGQLDHAALRQAFCHLVERHQSLRLCFPAVAGEATVRILPSYDPLVIITNPPESMDHWLQQQAQIPFDLAAGPLFRLQLLVLSAEEYLLCSNLHHIISDGWSASVLQRDWMQLYQAYSEQQTPMLAPLPVQYTDYAAWQQHEMAPILADQLAYWRARLQGAPHILELPIDHPRPARASYRGRWHSNQLSTELTTRVKFLSQTQGATLFMTLLTVFNTLLHRYTGQADLLVGTPVANRGLHETEDLIGLFMNTLVLRSTWQADQPVAFRDQLAQTRQTALEAYAHQDTPFEQIVEALNPERSLSHNPLYQVMLVLQNTPSGPTELPGLELTPEQPERQVAKLDLTVYVTEQAGQLTLNWEYATDLFTSDRIARMADHFTRLLAAVVDDPAIDLSRIPLLTKAETKQLQDWNATTADYPRHASLVTLFEAQVARTPDQPAVCDTHQTLSYAQLNVRANQIAHHLLSQADDAGQPLVRPGQLVGLCLTRSCNLLAGLLGILKAGAAYVPLDSDYPAARLSYLLTDSQTRLILTETPLQDTVTAWDTSCTIVNLDQVSEVSGDNPALPYQSGDLAYVLYTSGSTGQPKGVMIAHQSLVNFLCDMQQRTGIQAGDRLLAVTTLAFDIAGLELYLPLLSGATVQLASRDAARDGKQLQTLLQSRAIRFMQATPATWKLLLESGWQPSETLTLLCGGEALEPELGHRLAAHKSRVLNLYGPTETTIWSSAHSITQETTRPELIGQPIANTRIFILDAQHNLMPSGVPGELCIAGDGLAAGYLNRPDLTAEKFVQLELSGQTERVYKTGDLARWLPDGNLEYLGRTDHQVKLRGFRIELGEIETALTQHASVKDAVVVIATPATEPVLAAYVIPAASEVDVTALREQIATQLPGYMVPGLITSLAEFPLTPNGKLDRQALPAPDLNQLATAGELHSETEHLLAGIWSELLQTDISSPQADFFMLGGHSLLATRLANRVQHRLGIELPLHILFEHPQLGPLAAWLAQQHRHTLPPLTPQAGDVPNILSSAQQRLWFLEELEGPSATYTITAAQRVHGPLNQTAVQHSCQALVQRQSSLRQVFPVTDGAPGIAELTAYDPLTCHDLSHLSAEEQEGVLATQIQTLLATPFDLAQGPLLRIQLLKLAADEHLLIFSLHHIIADGWSLQILQREWAHLYQQACHPQSIPDLPPLPVQYADYATWQHQIQQTDAYTAQATYWQQQLDGAPQLLTLPTDYPRPAEQSYRGAHYDQQLSAIQTDRLQALSQQQGTTLYMTLLAVFNLLLHRYTGQDDLLVGSPIAGRTAQQTEDLIGLFVNTLVLRSTLNPAPETRYSDLLQHTRQTALAAYAHQELPFEQLVEQLQPERSLSHSPLIQVLFALQNHATDAPPCTDLEMTPYPCRLPITKFDLSLSIAEHDGQLHLHWEYAADLFRPERIANMGAHYALLLDHLLQEPEQPVHQLSLLTPAEQAQLLTWNETALPMPQDQTLLHRLAQQARQTPDRIAVQYADQTLSYQALDAQSNQLAHQLRSLTDDQGAPLIQPDRIVGLSAERSLEMVIGLLGILKAGAAYLPLDPDYPPARLQQMLTDSQPALLLTQHQDQIAAAIPADLTCLPLAQATYATQPITPVVHTVQPHHLAYVIYTSGSTGQPKGVMVSHAALHNHMVWMQHESQFRPTDAFLQKTPFSFDAAVWEFYAPLQCGARLVLAEPGRHGDVAYLHQTLQEQQITILQLVPTLLSAWLETHTFSDTPLRQLYSGGEELTLSLPQQIQQDHPTLALYNLYGPTETTIDATSWAVEPGSARIAIGRPIANVRAYVLDSHQQPVPPGIAGELYLAGAGLARGYLHQPELTAEKFRHLELFGNTERIYQTGDRACWQPDGTLICLGRIDQQIKLRGFRIELGEIEAMLSQQTEISEAAVILYPHAAQPILAAYVTSATDTTELTEQAIRAELKAHLPDYMLPGVITVLDQMPQTPSGKIDRRALPEPVWETASGNLHTETEQLLASLWNSVLKRPVQDAQAHFFDLGGHSLIAAQLAARIRDSFAVELPLRTLFAYPVLAELASWIDQQQSGDILPPITPQTADAELTLSYAQHTFWLRSQLDQQTEVHNMHLALQLDGPLQLNALRNALHTLHTRQTALRLYLPQGEQAEQVAYLDLHSPLSAEPTDLSSLTSAEQQTRIHTLLQQHKTKPFDLHQGPLSRVQLIRLAPERHLLLFTLHHIISDAWSLALWNQEWQALYQAACDGTTPNLPALPIQYTDYAAWQRTHLAGDRLQQHQGYWLEQLQDAPSLLQLPTDYPRPERQQGQGGRCTIQLSADTHQALQQLAQHQHSTVFMVLFSAFNLLLYRYSGQTDLCLGVPLANRHHTETEHLIGLFLNLVVLRTRLDGTADFATLLHQTRQQILNAQAHAEIPFAHLTPHLKQTHGKGYNPIFQVMFNWITTPIQPPAPTELQVTPYKDPITETHQAISNLDIVFALQPDADGGISGAFLYDTALFSPATIAFLRDSYAQLLEQIVTQTAQPLTQYTLADTQTPLHPLTNSQREIWLDQMIHADLPLYNIGGYVDIPGPLDHGLFNQAVNLLIQKHDNLRLQLTRSRDENELPQQTCVAPFTVPVAVHDVSAEPEPQAAAADWMQARFIEPFALEGQPLFRYDLIRLADDHYYWLLQYHHLITDGYGVSLLNRSLADLYTSLATDQSPNLQSPSYLTWIHQDRQYIQSATCDKNRQYWLTQYPSLPEPLFTPRYRSQYTEQLVPSGCEVLYLPRDFYHQLEQFAHTHRVSVFHVLTGALYVYFTRTLQRDDFTLGLAVLNRANNTLKNTGGMFAGVSPTWFNFGRELDFVSLVQQISHTLKGHYRHQRFPISELSRAVGLEQSRSQLFDVTLSFEQHNYDAVFDQSSGQFTALLHNFEQAPLTLFVRDFHQDHAVKIDFVYNQAYFNTTDIQSLQSYLQDLLAQALQHEATPINQWTLLTQADRAQLQTWNDTTTNYPTDKTLVDLFEAQVEQTPDNIAVSFEGKTLTYQQLNARANQLAHHLRSLTDTQGKTLIQSDTLVGICVERSLEMIVGLLAILKSGGAYVPLDPDYPAARLQHMLEDSQVPVLLTQQQLQEHFPQYTGVTVLTNTTEGYTHQPTHNLVHQITPDHLAYVIYTSGSTGKPKGVMLAHQGAVSLSYYQAHSFSITAGKSKVLQFASASFDAAVSEWVMTLLHGATLCLASRDQIRMNLPELLHTQHITHATLPPSVVHTLTTGNVPDLDTLVVAGEACPPDLMCHWSAHCHFYNAYGPTEATVCASMGHCDPTAKTVTIGKPIANARIYILDAQARLLPVGVAGELCIAGDGLARGYLNQPELTAEKFIEIELFGKTERVYKTGDLARWLLDGNLEYLGRVDHQVKLRGFRIELGEIEAMLCQHEFVNEAVVVLHEHEGNRSLAAYITTSQGSDIDLKDWLKSHLPDYMVPGSFTLLDHLPLTPNGKLDRKALPEPDLMTVAAQVLSTETERLLASLWSAVLKCEVSSSQCNFFELGGHSLLATKLVTQVREAFSIELPLARLFESPVLADLAHWLDQQQQGGTLSLIQVQPANAPKILSYAQQRLWFLAQLEGQSATYNMPMALRLQGQLDITALQKTLCYLVERHEGLRTCFPSDASTAQITLSDPYDPLTLTDLSHLTAAEQKAEVAQRAHEHTHAPFDLSTGPL
ncbi:MAG: amino acid adenylation domain-containing protein, partial [Pseudomonadota bacterium]